MHYSRKGCAFAVSRAATFDNISAFQLYQVQIIRQTLVKHTHTHTHTHRETERERQRERQREREREMVWKSIVMFCFSTAMTSFKILVQIFLT